MMPADIHISPYLLLFGIFGAGLCACAMELVRRVGAAEAALLLALSRWPLPLGFRAMHCVVLGPIAVTAMRYIWPREAEAVKRDWNQAHALLLDDGVECKRAPLKA